MKKILLTGGAGFIGSAFARYTVNEGVELVVLDALTYAGHKENLEGVNCEFVEGSITDAELVAQLLKKHQPDAVVHMAAESHVDNSIEAPVNFIETNIIGSYTMLEAVRNHYESLSGDAKSNFRYLQISTDEVYGSLGEEGYFTEESPMKPNSPYSASKAGADMLARAWCETYGLPVVITNCTNNYGPRQFPEKLIPVMITRALAGQSLPVYGDGKNVRDWIHVEDHCHGVWLALTKGRIGETYAFGGRAEKTNLELVHTLCDILQEYQPSTHGKPYKDLIAFVPDRLGHDRRYAIDDSKAEKELGFTRQHDFESGMRATVKWYLENTVWCEAVQNAA